MVIFHFLNEVRKELKALLTGSLLLTALGIYQVFNPAAHVPSWLYGAIVVVFLGWAFFGAWSKQYEKSKTFASQLEQIEKGKPRIKLREPGAVYSEPVHQHFRDEFGKTLRDQVVPFFKVRFINDPENSYPSCNANGIRAYIDYYRLPEDAHILSIDGRWAESDQPSAYSPASSKAHLLAVTFGIGEARSVDIAYFDPSGKCYAWNNDNYNYVDQFYVHPGHLLNGERFRVELRLRGDWIEKHVSIIFRAEDGRFLLESYDEK